MLDSIETTGDPVVEANIALLKARSELGLKKYGTSLADNNTDDMLRHALEEALDLANYLQAEIMKRNTALNICSSCNKRQMCVYGEKGLIPLEKIGDKCVYFILND